MLGVRKREGGGSSLGCFLLFVRCQGGGDHQLQQGEVSDNGHLSGCSCHEEQLPP